MKILHTGDLHLDSAFRSSDALSADKRREEQRKCLGRIFELAKKENCQMVLIAGDLFDGKYVTPETTRFVRELFASAGMPVVIAPGNHDPYVDGSFYKSVDLSDNVYVFSSNELQRFDFPELSVRVYGYAFTSSAISSSPLAYENAVDDGNGYITLLCAHGDTTSPISRYAPITAFDISKLGVDYAALGHVHNCPDTGLKNARYCGFAEGRSFDELGVGGVLLVELDGNGDCEITQKKVSMTRYEIFDVEVDGVEDRSDLRRRIDNAVSGFDGGDHVYLRLCLHGALDEDIMPDVATLERELSGNCLTVEIKNMTVPVASVNSLRADPSLRGAFYNSLYPQLVSEDPKVRERAALALRIGLAAIDGKRITGGVDGYEDT